MTLTRITRGDAHNITSGQVIIDLATASKELLENSLDAGATQVTVTFKNYGVNSIEVSDNGNGIGQDDFDGLCMKHYTSKLETFEDVASVRTLGFRGEALSSLCAMASVTITTSTKETQPKAHKLEYNQRGKLEKQQIASRTAGTTVLISDIFKNLPVRKTDLAKNARREFQKAITLLQSYALINTGVRLVLQHVDARGKKSMVLATTGSKELKNNVLSVFGANGMVGLEPVNMELNVSAKFRLKNSSIELRVHGFVSNCSFGKGRSSTDRQFWFINKRPVKLPHFSKAITEVYKSFNHLQCPVILLDIELDPQFVDVNVTPDKRTIFLHSETVIVEAVKEKMTEIFSEQDTSIPKSRLATERKESKWLQRDEQEQQGEEEQEPEQEHDDDPDEEQADDSAVDETVQAGASKSPQDLSADEPQSELPEELSEEMDGVAADSPPPPEYDQPEDVIFEKVTELVSQDRRAKRTIADLVTIHKASPEPQEPVEDADTTQLATSAHVVTETDASDVSLSDESTSNISMLRTVLDEATSPLSTNTCNHEHSPLFVSPVREKSTKVNQRVTESLHHTESSVLVNADSFRVKRPKLGQDPTKNRNIDDISDEIDAERKLTLSVSKKDFLAMKVIGQFNLGFILVTKTDKSGTHLFIIDQHASDEKYNFERFQTETVFNNQPLVVHQPLELNVLDELAVMNHLQVFEKNGFGLVVDEDLDPGHRIKLVSLPYSKDTTFDLSDLDELIHLVKEHQGKGVLRPSKVRAMFAMRACRSSIMIGKPLNHKTMAKVVTNLSTLDKPWNCPHGRPTMRHLIELKNWATFNKDYET
ncbi:hypothetical protein OGAPHI_001785 [Ogataea philodendri]|uniref:DNA mismatch repair protein PMS1 n=2 Tax=Ogataea TaxID=461281 RepID=A0A9P8T7J1_9ASCO|nr:uncharacterized protein OGAPHI_001785 [Ogataea philodendri]KAH3668031.1 hypothetical protein OGAPHI_001785 [Ogataea philodendri]